MAPHRKMRCGPRSFRWCAVLILFASPIIGGRFNCTAACDSDELLLESDGPHSLDQEVQEFGGTYEHGEVPAAWDRYELLVRRLDRSEVLPGEFRRGRKILGALKEEDRDGELQSEVLRLERCCLIDQSFAAQHLAGFVIDEVLH